MNETNININEAINKGTIVRCQPNDTTQSIIKDALKKETKSFLLTTFIISIVCIVALIVLVIIHNFILEKIGFVIIKYALFIIPGLGALSPLYGIYDFFSKNKCIKRNLIIYYIANILGSIENSDAYQLVGVNYEKAEYLKKFKPSNKPNQNDKVLLIRIDGENYLADLNQLNDSSLMLINTAYNNTTQNI